MEVVALLIVATAVIFNIVVAFNENLVFNNKAIMPLFFIFNGAMFGVFAIDLLSS